MDDMLADFSAAATRIALRGQDATDYELVHNLALAVKNGEPTSAIYGRVIDQDGVGVEGAVVSFTNAMATVIFLTDAFGRFCTTNLTAGTWYLSTQENLVSDNAGIISTDGDNDVDAGTFAVHRAVNASITLAGATWEEALLSIADDSGAVHWTQRQLSRTQMQVLGLAEGEYFLSCSRNGIVRGGTLVVREGDSSEFVFDFSTNAVLTLSFASAGVTDNLGFILFDGDRIERSVELNGDVTYELDDICSGTYITFVKRRGDADGVFAAVEVSSVTDGTTLEIDCSELATRDSASASTLRSTAMLRGTSSADANAVTRRGRDFYDWGGEEVIDDRAKLILRPVNFPEGEYDCEHNRALYAKKLDARQNFAQAFAEYKKDARDYELAEHAAADKFLEGLTGALSSSGSVVWRISKITFSLKLKAIGMNPMLRAGLEFAVDAGESAWSIFKALSNGGMSPDEAMDELVNVLSAGINAYQASTGEDLGILGTAFDWGKYAKEFLSSCSEGVEFGENLAKMRIAVLDIEHIPEELHQRALNAAGNFYAAANAYEALLNTPYTHKCPEYGLDIPLFEDEVDSVTPTIATSIDPNEVSGPYGLGDPDTERFVKPGEWLDFTIYFENATNATASAREVNIREDLSPYLDWESIQLGEVVFANETDMGLAGTSGGTSEYAVPGTNYLVRTTFTQRNGLANWYLRLVDPEGDEDGWPLDEWLYTYGGFLPPNTTNHVGEGHVSYRIKVRDDAPKNVRIVTSAAITFDSHETIPTDPSWWNTIGHLPVALTFDRNCDDVVLDMPTNGAYTCDAPDFGTPTREGWLFLGWADTNGVPRNCGADLPYDTAALDLYAQWREEVETKFATIAVDGGVLITGLADGQTCPADLVIPATVEVGGRRVKVIGVADDAFKGKRAIQSLTVKEGVRTIGARSFMNCTSLASVSLPSTIESIGENAFYGCRLLSSVTIAAETPPTLGADAFRSVASAGVLTVPDGGEAAYGAWIGTDLGSAWTVEGYNPGEPVEPGEPAWTILPDQNLLLYAAGASDVRWAIEVDIDADGGLTLVQATGSAEPGEDFVLPDSVLDSDGNEYRIVAIGANADILDAGIFEGQEFVSVTIPESVETIAPCAFANCAGLREVVFAGDEPALRELGEGAFFSCTSLSAIDLAPLSSLERIGLLDAILGVFESCWYLPEVTLPATVETIGAYAFQDCSRLRAVRAGGGDAALTAIGERAFYNCDSLESVETGCLAALETMGDAAFGGDTAASAPKIARIALGTAIASLGADVFLNAAQLAEVTCLATNPPARDANAFRGMLRTGILRLPEQAIEDYTNETARAWVGAGAGKLTPWNGSTGWQVKSGDAGSMLREMESHLTDEEFEAFLALATLLGFTGEELCEVDHPAEQLAPELRIVSFNPDAAEYPLAIRFENGIDETPAAAFARLWSASGDKIFAAVSDELGGVERRVPLLGTQGDDGFFRVNLGTAFHRDEPAQFVRIIIQ